MKQVEKLALQILPILKTLLHHEHLSGAVFIDDCLFEKNAGDIDWKMPVIRVEPPVKYSFV